MGKATKSVSLERRCKDELTAREWKNAWDYYRYRKYKLLSTGPESVSARVFGSADEPYLVVIDWSAADEEDLLIVDCTCPRFLDTGACKHVGTIIIAIDSLNLAPNLSGNLPLVFDDSEFEGDSFVSDDDEATGDEGFGDSFRSPRSDRKTKGPRRQPAPAKESWMRRFKAIEEQAREATLAPISQSTSNRPEIEYWYVVRVPESRSQNTLVIDIHARQLLASGALGKLKKLTAEADAFVRYLHPEDRTTIGFLRGGRNTSAGHNYGYSFTPTGISQASLDATAQELALPMLCATSRFTWVEEAGDVPSENGPILRWDAAGPWGFRLTFDRDLKKKSWSIAGELIRRDEAGHVETRPLSTVLLALGSHHLICRDAVLKFDERVAPIWLELFNEGPLVVPEDSANRLVEQFARLPPLPEAHEWPDDFRLSEVACVPVPHVKFLKNNASYISSRTFELSFQYGERNIPADLPQASLVDTVQRTVHVRDLSAEAAACRRLVVAGARPSQSYIKNEFAKWMVDTQKVEKLIVALIAEGWEVQAPEGRYQKPGAFDVQVKSGIDWFDLEATCEYDGELVALPQLLQALRDGKDFVNLSNGSKGLLPREWLEQFKSITSLGTASDTAIRFKSAQAMLLDVLLSSGVSNAPRFDETFANLRRKLATCGQVAATNEPASFQGELRHYQREGLGWLDHLSELGFGGCLADDMGLGKTAQVLAFLEARRLRHLEAASTRDEDQSASKPLKSVKRKKAAPRKSANATTIQEAMTDALPALDDGVRSLPRTSIAVVPKSLVFNWMEEAARFTPELRIADYTGTDRKSLVDKLGEFDLVLTTYATLRLDIDKLIGYEFDYAILDEAQAVKNATSQAAKACRLIRSRRRLAMTGTPVENHLGELWSLFEFLNPGMLGTSQSMKDLFNSKNRVSLSSAGDESPATPESGIQRGGIELLARAVRPFLLRRTKEQVLKDLPAKIEQTLYCELGTQQRKLYNELRDYYRTKLLNEIREHGVDRSKIQVLEALLRLRQAACHPGLLDAKNAAKESAKLELLFEQIDEIVQSGHKALVFSQFTSLLAIVRRELDERKIGYEYLDGKTNDRQKPVARFQDSADCQVFLISLKAGGFGLNLTAADYVFILDPWWNPAVEAQAVDRAHRMGQSKQVFAYRLIARDTVEEKILALQSQKRDLAEAIVSADNSVLKNLTSDDLQLLLS